MRILLMVALSMGLWGCGDQRPGHSSDPLTVERAFTYEWCDRENELPLETAQVVALLVNAVDAGTCESAAPKLAAAKELTLTQTLSGPIRDLRPLGTLTGLQTLKLTYLQIDSVATLMPLQSLTHLENLDLTGNALTHVRGLSRYTRGLRELTLSANPLVENETTNLLSPTEATTWEQMKTLHCQSCGLGVFPKNLPASVVTLDFRKNAFNDKSLLTLAREPQQPLLYPHLKLVLLHESYPGMTNEAVGPLFLQAQSWMPETHFKAY